MIINPERTRMDLAGYLMDSHCLNGCKKDKDAEELALCFYCGMILCDDCWRWHRQQEFMHYRFNGLNGINKGRCEFKMLFPKSGVVV